jgi:hypothetical protein
MKVIEIEIINPPLKTGKPLKGKMVENNIRFEFNDIDQSPSGIFYKFKDEKILIIATVNWIFIDDDIIETDRAYYIGQTTDRFYLLDTNLPLEED